MLRMHTAARTDANTWIDQGSLDDDVYYLESHWRRMPIGSIDLPLIDIGTGDPLVCVPILEHLEFVYAQQIRSLSQSRRVILYRRREARSSPCGLGERVEELLMILDSLELVRVDLLGHGDAAMVLMEFAARYPQRCRSLIIIAQGADYRIAPHPLIWLLHELLVRLPVEHFLPAWFLRHIVINYIIACDRRNNTLPALPKKAIEAQFRKIEQWPFVYKFSVLPIIHSFDMRDRLNALTMPILLINRTDDVLSPEAQTRWLAQHLPTCLGYHVVSGRERFFLYSRAEVVTPIIATFLESRFMEQ